MPDDTYVVKTSRLVSLLMVFVGAGLLYLGLDLHYFHLLRGWKVGPNNLVWLLLSGLGILLGGNSVRIFVKPQTRLKADAQGITLYAGNVTVSVGGDPSAKLSDTVWSAVGTRFPPPSRNSTAG